MDPLDAAVIRTLAYHAAWKYAPTRVQLLLSLDVGPVPVKSSISPPDVLASLDGWVKRGTVVEVDGRLSLAQFAEQAEEGREREIYFPRKLRRARRVAGYLKMLPWVRAVCLCNTTALGQAQDGGDLDFFVVVRAGAIWRSRFFATLPFKLLGARPGSKSKDPVCLSFFVADDALDLLPLTLAGDDPYFRHWYLSLLPLQDDGALAELWQANRLWLESRHPLAKPWFEVQSPVEGHGTGRPAIRPQIESWPPVESWLKKFQARRFPRAIRELANRDTRVVTTDHVLKFHVDDRRETFKEKYYAICRDCGIQP